eukprot:TRINITY_DN15171_c0_g1_i1.p1 TRINITY_DN15171_c0_g1~~TRINITY_DN15171_c0_g1_i1.p1  ORF type:complete len:322 (-),score=48.95 TRINITY_DN15171_c0_g1_i1:571-1536(-)
MSMSDLDTAASTTADSPEEEEDTYGDPGAETAAAGTSLVPALAKILTYLSSSSREGRPQRLTRFHAVRAPALSILEYLTRLSTYFQCSNECFVLSLVYIDRIVKKHPEFSISPLNIHRLVVTSVMMAAKFFDDVYYANSYYARVGGVKTSELNTLEETFLRLIEWRLHVLPEEYENYRRHVLAASRDPAAAGRLQVPGTGQVVTPVPLAAGLGVAGYSAVVAPVTYAGVLPGSNGGVSYPGAPYTGTGSLVVSNGHTEPSKVVPGAPYIANTYPGADGLVVSNGHSEASKAFVVPSLMDQKGSAGGPCKVTATAACEVAAS